MPRQVVLPVPAHGRCYIWTGHTISGCTSWLRLTCLKVTWVSIMLACQCLSYSDCSTNASDSCKGGRRSTPTAADGPGAVQCPCQRGSRCIHQEGGQESR